MTNSNTISYYIYNNYNENNLIMKEFILLNRVPAGYNAEDATAVREKWNHVTDRWKADNTFVSSFIFPGTGHVITGNERAVKKEQVLNSNLKMVSTIIIRAADIDAAVELSKACPILEQGGMVEVNEIQARPVIPQQ